MTEAHSAGGVMMAHGVGGATSAHSAEEWGLLSKGSPGSRVCGPGQGAETGEQCCSDTLFIQSGAHSLGDGSAHIRGGSSSSVLSGKAFIEHLRSLVA